MSHEKKETTPITVSLLSDDIKWLDEWRLNEEYDPSRSKLFQRMLSRFRKEHEKEHEKEQEREENIPEQTKKEVKPKAKLVATNSGVNTQ
jgi:hypothetical protein